jgi:hypothetical protein
MEMNSGPIFFKFHFYGSDRVIRIHLFRKEEKNYVDLETEHE